MMQNGAFTRDLSTMPDGSPVTQQAAGGMIPRFYKNYKRGRNGGIVASEYVEILMPGDSKSSPVRKVTDTIRHQYPNQYAAFLRGEELSPEGTPVEMWPHINASLARTLKSMNIFTVEQLAEVPDTAVGNLMGGRGLRDRAKVYLEASKNTAVADALEHERQRLQDQVTFQQNQTADLAAKLAAMEREMEALRNSAGNDDAPAPKRGPGRPRSNPPPDDNDAA